MTSRCRDCQQPIAFEVTDRGAKRPINADGVPRPATCPESPRNKRPAVPDNICAACGSDNVEREPGTGPHFGALRCHECGAHRWLRRPLEAKA